jgi:hypothetical protein
MNKFDGKDFPDTFDKRKEAEVSLTLILLTSCTGAPYILSKFRWAKETCTADQGDYFGGGSSH